MPKTEKNEHKNIVFRVSNDQKEMIESALLQYLELNREAMKYAEPGKDEDELKAEARLIRATIRSVRSKG